MVERYDVVIDGTDNFPPYLRDVCVFAGKPTLRRRVRRWSDPVSLRNLADLLRCLFTEATYVGTRARIVRKLAYWSLPGVIGR